MTSEHLAIIDGSQRRPILAAQALGPVDDAQEIEVALYARQNPAGAALRAHAMLEANKPPLRRKRLSEKEFAHAFGADAKDIEAIAHWAQKKGLRPTEENPATRRVVVKGPAGAFMRAFNTKLQTYQHPEFGRFRARVGDLRVSAKMAGLIDGVFGLDTRPVGRPNRRRHVAASAPASTAKVGLPPPPMPGSFYPPQLAALYNYPALTGAGQNIAVFAFNGTGPDPRGGYSAAALQKYYETILGATTPSITDVVVAGPGNDPGPDTQESSSNGDSTGEIMLDLCVVGALLPGANILVYFSEFTSRGWIDALTRCITDGNGVSVISISYGNPEDDPHGSWTRMGVRVVNQAMLAAAAKNITVCCASGDGGAGDDAATGVHVDFPASSPNVLGVGGTTLVAAGNAIATETAWNEEAIGEGATGGGVSRLFSKPTWQAGANVPPTVNPPHVIGRGVPDVAAVGDPSTGAVVMHVSGTATEVVGGTSLSAPLWASLVTRLNQGLGTPCGFLNPTLYQPAVAAALHDVTGGDNGAYAAGPGWDACTGLGTPNGAALLSVLQSL